MDRHKKKAARLKAWLVFLDETGMLMAPLVRRSWAPCGRSPVLYQYGAHHRKVSVCGALAVSPDRHRVGFYFRLYPNRDIHAAEVIAFLRHLDRELGGPWILLWDRLNAHRATRTQHFLATRSYPQTHFLPAYAPELNPVENVWSYLKTHSMANLVAFDLDTLTLNTRRHTRSLQRRPILLRSLLKHTPLFLPLR